MSKVSSSNFSFSGIESKLISFSLNGTTYPIIILLCGSLISVGSTNSPLSLKKLVCLYFVDNVSKARLKVDLQLSTKFKIFLSKVPFYEKEMNYSGLI